VQWPAFWTTTTDGWPAGGEIDILEGANALPQVNSAAYNATIGLTSPKLDTLPDTRATASLHTSAGCSVDQVSSYMTGQQGYTTCDASLNANAGCGVEFGNNTFGAGGSFGAGVNAGDGGWYAMWRDMEG
jgi:beta-glucanase (GH16 family)